MTLLVLALGVGLEFYGVSLEMLVPFTSPVILGDSVCDTHCTGTFEPEKKTDDIVYGVTHKLHSWNPLYIQVSCTVYCFHHLQQ